MVDITALLQRVAAGEVSVPDARDQLEGFTRLDDFAKLDTTRERRTGTPEVILGDGKSPDDLATIAHELIESRGHVLVTRVSDEAKPVLESIGDYDWHERARVMVLRDDSYTYPDPIGTVAVVSGGTADIPVADEAAITAQELHCTVERTYDVGVAGIHRLLAELDPIRTADCVIVTAGREGSLPTVVAGLVEAPVIGVPVSEGYGYGADGEAALMSMLQSCTVLSTVNIDAGFVAGAQAARIVRSNSNISTEPSA